MRVMENIGKCVMLLEILNYFRDLYSMSKCTLVRLVTRALAFDHSDRSNYATMNSPLHSVTRHVHTPVSNV